MDGANIYRVFDIAILVSADGDLTLYGKKFSNHVFQALSWRNGWKDDPRLCWRAKEGVLTKYSNDLLPLLKQVSAAELETALKAYREHNRKKGKTS